MCRGKCYPSGCGCLNYESACNAIEAKVAWEGLQRSARLHRVSSDINHRKLEACEYTLRAMVRGTHDHLEEYGRIKHGYHRGLEHNLALNNAIQDNFIRQYNHHRHF
jgi:hypothetical protein